MPARPSHPAACTALLAEMSPERDGHSPSYPARHPELPGKFPAALPLLHPPLQPLLNAGFSEMSFLKCVASDVPQQETALTLAEATQSTPQEICVIHRHLLQAKPAAL